MMNKWIKLILFFALAMVCTQFTFLASFAAENNTAVENFYQEKAAATLNTLIRAEDYKLIVLAPFDRTNTLSSNSLNQKIQIQVLLATDAPRDRDALIKEILKSKLKLNSENGDTIIVNHVLPQITDARKNNSPAPWTGLLMGSFCCVFAVWFSRKKKTTETPVDLNQVAPLAFISENAIVEYLEQGAKKEIVHSDNFENGAVLATHFMRSLDASREEALLNELQNHYPDEVQKLRAVRVMFQDLPHFPEVLVIQACEAFSSSEIAMALQDQHNGLIESFLSFLPATKAVVVQDEIYATLEGTNSVHASSEQRRKICVHLEQMLEAQQFDLSSFWTKIDSNPQV